MIDYADVIKEQVSCRDFAEHAGLEINRAGFCCCPFHGEKTPSLKIYKDGRGWYCFGCHQGGDVLTFAQKWYGEKSFQETIKNINAEFNLGLKFGAELSNNEKALLAVQSARRKAEASKQKRLKEEIEINYWRCFDRVMELRKVIEQYAPKSKEDDWSDEWADAVKIMPYAEYLLETAEEQRRTNYAK